MQSCVILDNHNHATHEHSFKTKYCKEAHSKYISHLPTYNPTTTDLYMY